MVCCIYYTWALWPYTRAVDSGDLKKRMFLQNRLLEYYIVSLKSNCEDGQILLFVGLFGYFDKEKEALEAFKQFQRRILDNSMQKQTIQRIHEYCRMTPV
jgi:hypothetical protein